MRYFLFKKTENFLEAMAKRRLVLEEKSLEGKSNGKVTKRAKREPRVDGSVAKESTKSAESAPCAECCKLPAQFLKAGHFVPIDRPYRLSSDSDRLELGLKMCEIPHALVIKTGGSECPWKVVLDSEERAIEGIEAYLVEIDGGSLLSAAPCHEWYWFLGRFFTQRPQHLYAALGWTCGSVDANALGILSPHGLEAWVLFSDSLPLACFVFCDETDYCGQVEYDYSLLSKRYCIQCSPTFWGKSVTERDLMEMFSCDFSRWQSLCAELLTTGSVRHDSYRLVKTTVPRTVLPPDSPSEFLALVSSMVHLESFQTEQRTHTERHKQLAIKSYDGKFRIIRRETPTLSKCSGEDVADSLAWLRLPHTPLNVAVAALAKHVAGFSPLERPDRYEWALTGKRFYFASKRTNGEMRNWYFYNGLIYKEPIPYTTHDKISSDTAVVDSNSVYRVIERKLPDWKPSDDPEVERLARLCWRLLDSKDRKIKEEFSAAFCFHYERYLDGWERRPHPLTIQNAFFCAASAHCSKRSDQVINFYEDEPLQGCVRWAGHVKCNCKHVFKHFPNVPATLSDLAELEEVQQIGTEFYKEPYLLVLGVPIALLLPVETDCRYACVLVLTREKKTKFREPEFVGKLKLVRGKSLSTYEPSLKQMNLLLLHAVCISCRVRF